jgi:hypothetical protein
MTRTELPAYGRAAGHLEQRLMNANDPIRVERGMPP